MKLIKFLFSVCLVAIIFTCTSNLTNPFTQDKAQVFLHLESSAKFTSDSTITDTAGNKVSIGISYFMPGYFDSVIITIGKTIQNLDTFFIRKKADIKDDTAWYDYTFKSEGTRTITATGFVAGGNKPTASATITVIARPVLPINHKPTLIITGRKSITTAEACTLFVSANDSDAAQAHSYQVLKGPSGYGFANQIFTWKPTAADTGIDSVTFTVADNGTPIMADTQTIALAVSGIVIPVNHKPTLIIAGKKAISLTEICTLSVSANHADSNQTLTYKVLKGPQGYTFSNQVFIWKPTAADTGIDSVTFTVADNGIPIMSDTQTIAITVSGIVFPSNHKPTLKTSGLKTITTAEICTLTISVTDPDSGQSHPITILNAPQGYAFKDSIFTWLPPTGFLGSDTIRKDSVIFTTVDNGIPPLHDTLKAIITVVQVPKIIPKKFTLTLNTIGNGTTTPSTSAQVDSSADTAVTATASQGNSFVNWTSSSINATIANSTNAATRIRLNGNATVTANFKPDSFKITFDPNQGSGTMAQQTMLPGATANLSLNAYTRTGYTFTGWTIVPDGPIAYYDGSSYTMGKSAVVLYAKWTIKTYVLTIIKTGNGTTNPAPGTVDVDTGAATTITAKPAIGYSFANWSVSGPALVKSLSSDSTTVKLNGDASVTANFTIIPYTLTVTSNGNGNATGGGDGNYGTVKNISATPASGYQFVNWTITSGTVTIGNTTNSSTTATLTNANATVQANFTAIMDTIKFVCNGGSTIANLPIQYGKTIGTAPTTTMTGFIVDGWYTDANFTNKYNFSSSITFSFTLYAKWIIKDINGNIYDTVKIGNQIWMKQNFKATKYNDNTPITLITDSAAWANCTSEGYCYYNNTTNGDTINKFGALYNWYAINTGKLAPAGWHVPSKDEWDTLQNYLIANGYNWDLTTTGNKIGKSMAAKTDWSTANSAVGIVGNNLSGNNKSGFTGLPAGQREGAGIFSLAGIIVNWWSTTNAGYAGAYYCYLYNLYENLYRNDMYNNWGFSVRLLRN